MGKENNYGAISQLQATASLHDREHPRKGEEIYRKEIELERKEDIISEIEIPKASLSQGRVKWAALFPPWATNIPPNTLHGETDPYHGAAENLTRET